MSEEANKPAPVEAAAAAPEVDAPASKPAEIPAETNESKETIESKPESEKTEGNKEAPAQNVKSDFKALPTTDDPNLIRSQVRLRPVSIPFS